MLALRLAEPADEPAVSELVTAAYSKYIPRIGRKPAPMVADYAALIAAKDVFVLSADGWLCGVLVLLNEPDRLLIENVALAPAVQGKGYGSYLMTFAEAFARELGYPEIRLYTNAKMMENIAIYQHLGYVETNRRGQGGYERVFMTKKLSA